MHGAVALINRSREINPRYGLVQFGPHGIWFRAMTDTTYSYELELGDGEYRKYTTNGTLRNGFVVTIDGQEGVWQLVLDQQWRGRARPVQPIHLTGFRSAPSAGRLAGAAISPQ